MAWLCIIHTNEWDFFFVFVWCYSVVHQTHGGIPDESKLSPSPEQMEFCRNLLSKWNFVGILFGGLLARIAKYLLNGSPREVKFHSLAHWPPLPLSSCLRLLLCPFCLVGCRVVLPGAPASLPSLSRLCLARWPLITPPCYIIAVLWYLYRVLTYHTHVTKLWHIPVNPV